MILYWRETQCCKLINCWYNLQKIRKTWIHNDWNNADTNSPLHPLMWTSSPITSRGLLRRSIGKASASERQLCPWHRRKLAALVFDYNPCDYWYSTRSTNNPYSSLVVTQTTLVLTHGMTCAACAPKIVLKTISFAAGIRTSVFRSSAASSWSPSGSLVGSAGTGCMTN